MANPQINISSLTFDDIKTSLKAYLNNPTLNPQFVGYNFDASALNTLLDIFSYNTLFYSFYSNMIANETFLSTASLESSIVSLVKPLGYLVPGKSSAKIQLNVSSASGSVTVNPYSSVFTGFSPSGNSYLFYSIEGITVSSQTNLSIYEAKSVVNNLQVTVDITEQKVFLGNTNVDINTLTLKVNGVTWTKYNTFQSNPGSEGTVYFLDRTSSGFYVIFGKRTINDYQTTFGKTIAETDVVTVSYLIPSGAGANNINSVTNTNLVISSVTPSIGGADGADLDLVKFFAPKMFAANDRAVTRDDYYGVLFNSDVLPANITNINQINVWGGEDADPPVYGRVFVSFSDQTLTKTTPSVLKCIQFLKNKSVVTVIPEYVQSQIIKVSLTIRLTTVSGLPDIGSNVLTYVNAMYNTNKIFNNNINANDIKQKLLNAYPSNIRSVIVEPSKISLLVSASAASKNVYFRNEFIAPQIYSLPGTALFSDIFSYNGQNIRFKDSPTKFDENNYALEGELLGIIDQTTTSVGIIGYINYTSGYITINPGVLPISSTLYFNAFLKYPDNIIIKNESVLIVDTLVIHQST